MSRRKNKRFKHGISPRENAEMRKRQRETLRRLRGDYLSIMITLRQLRYLDALAQYRHFGRAADACAVTQPALSMQIQDLEKQLEVDLVERRPGEVALTEIGIEVARRGERILAALRDLIDFARRRRRILSGRLKLGIIPSLAPYLLPKVLPALQVRHPDLTVELRETQTKILVEELARGNLDAVMLALPVVDAEIETIRLFDDPILLAVPAKDPLPETARVSARQIDQQRLILPEEGHCLRDQALAYCATARQSMPLSVGATNLATVMQMVASGYGVTLVPQVAVDVEVRDQRVKLLRFTAPEPGRTIGLAWRRTSPRKIDFVALGQIVVEALTGGSRGNRSARGSKMSRRKNKRFKHGISPRENAEMRKRQRETLRRLRRLLSELKGK